MCCKSKKNCEILKYIKKKEYKWFWINRYNVIRCMLLLLCFGLFLLSVLYSIAQLNELGINDYFCDKKELNVIYQHSKDNNLIYGTKNGCWSSKGIIVDESKLYSINVYTSFINYNDINNIIKCSLFLLTSLFLLVCLIYFLSTLVYDWYKFKKGYFKPKQRHSNVYVRMYDPNDNKNNCCVNSLVKIKNKLIKFKKKHMEPDYGGWMILLFSNELFEIIIQIINCIQYNGI